MAQKSQVNSSRNPDFVRSFTEKLLEELRKEGLYPISELYSALKSRNYPATYNTVVKNERRGIILEPSERRMIRGHMWRLYTKERIAQIISHLDSIPHQRILR